MKAIILRIAMLVVVLLSVCGKAYAEPARQNCPGSREQWAIAQAEQIAKDLNLDPEKTAKFKKTYLDCQKEIWKLGPPSAKGIGSQNVKTEKEAGKILKSRFENRRKFNDIQEKYYKKYSSFLTQLQIMKFYDSERHMMEKHARKAEARGKAKRARQQQNKGRKSGPEL